ncbi:unnamed protein product [Rotaria sp. Silwood1]|nr:unnamed protein product [Rotaria sp. Silwood1]CAF1165899.1 unnamed protein product [Rotaria sp. Silwood1]CAF4852467.1 unnamed protein product [Rotaria sp. Silwood1]CAF4907067.1 unnamed protein product [Rotaria sp. Silwood1]CAF4908021.1 unnamed protein product [Rotaria sp. Silwood1]
MASVNAASNSNNEKLDFITSSKGQPLLVMNNYIFVHTDINNNYLCGGKNEYEHAANPELLEIHQTRQQIKRQVMNELTPIGAVYDEKMSKTSMSSTAIAIFPTVREIYQGFAKTRRKAMPPAPQSCIFDIPEQYTLTIDNKRFLLFDEARVR